MVFSISLLDVPPGVDVEDLLSEELYWHIRHNHVDLPSEWRAG